MPVESPGNICTDSKVDDTESVKKKFSVGTDTAKKIHAAAMKLLKAWHWIRISVLAVALVVLLTSV